MSKRQLSLGDIGKNWSLEPAAARRLLGWIEDLVGCSQEELAERAGVTSRSLRNFATGGGGQKMIVRLAEAVPVPLWVVHETMLPTIAVVNQVWWSGCGGRVVGEGAFGEARNGAIALAARVSVVAFLAKRDKTEIEGIIRPGRARYWAGLHPVDARITIRWLQSLGGGTRKEFAAAAGLSHEALRMYEAGEWPLEMPVLGLVVEGAGLPLWFVEGVMLPAISAVRLISQNVGCRVILAGWVGALTAVPVRIIQSQQPGWRGGLLLAPVQQVSVPGPSAEDRIVADDLWRRLEGRSPTERVLLVKNCRELHSWSLVLRLCDESREAASDSAKAALGLALLALRVARLVREEELFCLQLEGFALFHVSNSQRVAGTQRRAKETFLRGLDCWKAGLATNHNLLPVWRVLDLEASLLRDHREFDQALDRLERALKVAPREAWARILINKATVLYLKMEPDASIAALREAASLIDEGREPHLSFLRTSMLGVNFCHLERYREAKDLLPGAQALAAELRGSLDNLRLEWLRGRIEGGLGHREEALSALTWVQGELENRKIAYDYALVSLEVGEILLTQGRFAEVQDLAVKMEWIFKREEIHSEAANALDLFRRAVEDQQATPELARSVVRYLYRAQYNPELKYAV